MKKIFTLISVLSFVALGANAQVDTLLYENFDVDNTATYEIVNNGNDLNWVDYDADGYNDGSGQTIPRGGNWYWSANAFGGNDTTGCLLANSWFSPAGTAKNYLILPPVTLADGSGILSWKACPRQTPLYVDGYKVMVSTTDNFEASFTDTIFVAAEYISNVTGAGLDFSMYTFSPGFVHGADGTYTEVDPSPTATALVGLMQPFTASLAAYAGQTIYIAYLHDSGDDNLMAIDDIMVTQDEAVGLTENSSKAESIKVYPNPTSDKMDLEFNLKASASVTVKITDTKGSVVKEIVKGTQQAGNQKISVNVSDLSSGVYSVSLIAGDKTTRSNVVINRQ